MGHYDGPAFYRKYFNGKLPFNDKEKDEKNLINESDDTDNKDTDSNKYKAKTVKDESQVINDKEHEAAWLKRAKNFKPSVSSRTIKTYKLNNDLSKFYLRILNELSLSDDDLIKFEDSSDNFEKLQENQSESGKVISNDSEALIDEVVPDIKDDEEDSVEETNSNTEDRNNVAENNQKESTEVINENGEESVEETNLDTEANNAEVKQDTEEIYPKLLTKSYENDYERAVDNSEESTDKSNSNSGLGHSLAEIMQRENVSSDRIKLFDKPAKNVENEASENLYKESFNESKLESVKQDEEKPIFENSNLKMTNLDEINRNYQKPSLSLLKDPVTQDSEDMDEWIQDQSIVLDDTLKAFNVDAHVVDWTNGPTVTQFQIKLALGVKVSKITHLIDDLKLALAAKDIRIEAPIPGKSTVGIEIPNPSPRPVMLSEILNSKEFKESKSILDIALGVSIEGKPVVGNIQKMPHGLIAGATGSGKSVFINSLLLSLLYKTSPDELKLILIDPKAVELAPYNELPHLITPVVSDPKEASAALKWVTNEMDERYEKLSAAGVRNIEQFNDNVEKSNDKLYKMPYIVVIIDELADLMMVSSNEVQDYIVRITQKARAAGIHLIIATQRPSVDVVTGTIKNNIPTRTAFMVSSQVDSRTIIDSSGAERLLGKGDMLFLGNGSSKPIRLQGAFVTNEEVEAVTDEVRKQGTPKYEFHPKSLLKKADQAKKHDEIWKEVLKFISDQDTISTSKLQRVFSIGYNRAATLIDDLETSNYISGQHGSKPRDVYLTKDDYQKLNI